ncbi:ABC transporter permease [Prevotella koreensis]
MRQFMSFVIKESKHILRDRRTLMILFGMPVVMLLLFGFAISTDVKNVRMVVVSSSIDNETQKVIDRINASEYFTVQYFVETVAEAKLLMRDMRADMTLVFSAGYADNPYSHSIQILVDGTDPNTALTRTAYVQQIITNVSSPPVVARMLYNPQMKSAYNFVPGIMGMLLMLICAMMTSVSIAREKERGTMEVLLVSPMRPLMIIIAKAVPYFLLSIFILVIVLLISRYVLDVPLAGNIISIFLVSMLYILLALSLGLLISVVAGSQLVAMLVSGMLLLMPSILLSGMIYPIESMPDILQWISYAMPARWFISAIKKLMIMGVSWQMAIKEIAVMSVMTVSILAIALAKFKTRLE